MVANRLKNLAQLTRGAVRDVRRALEDLIDGLAVHPKPQAVPIPVRANNGGFRPPFGPAGSRRSFSTSPVFRAYATNQANFRALRTANVLRFARSKPVPASLRWPFYASPFKLPFPNVRARGPMPGSLYRNFVNIGMRNLGTAHGGSYSNDAIQNLFIGLKSMMHQSSFSENRKLASSVAMRRDDIKSRSFHGSASQRAAVDTLQFARAESSNLQRLGAYVEFSFPNVELSIPTVAFMNSEIMASIEEEFEKIKQQIDSTNANIKSIFEAYGCLPIERTGSSVRIHFPNLDSEEVEKLLIELNIKEGLVYSMDEMDMMQNASASNVSSSYLSDILQDNVPGLVSSSASVDSESDCDSAEFFPVLSSSGNSQYVTPIDPSEMSSPVVIADTSFSEISL